MTVLNVAVVGSGISGLAAAWLLSKRHNVTLFESDSRLGGHANTVDVDSDVGSIPIDTGFIVYNPSTYPNLTALLEHLNVETAESCMSFSVSLGSGSYEYSGTGLHGLFGQPSNLLNIEHWRLASDLLRFLRKASDLSLEKDGDSSSLGDWLQSNRYSKEFVTRHILPMGAAIWSVPAEQMLAFPVASFARFFSNHGLLKIRNRPKWRTIPNGSRAYVRRIAKNINGVIKTDFEVCRIYRSGHGVDLHAQNGAAQRFDQCVLACHADQSLRLLADASVEERRTLSPFRYSNNRAVLHRDTSFMPTRRRLWSSWNYVSARSSSEQPGVTYWMNRLQPLATTQDYFVTINPDREVPERDLVREFFYQHPIFDAPAIGEQSKLWHLQGRNRTWFCGSYFGYGFHEDGLQAGLAVAEGLGGVRRPWNVKNESDRLHFDTHSGTHRRLEAAE
ncbi:MAG: NAD(P)/FAD-dependent oxidoreductase [Hyphomicrobiaceae bacterium]